MLNLLIFLLYIIGDWGLGPIPNPQSPIPNPQSPIIYNNNISKSILIYFKYNN